MITREEVIAFARRTVAELPEWQREELAYRFQLAELQARRIATGGRSPRQ